MVMCSSNEIRSHILKWNTNAVVSLDYLENEYSFSKNDYEVKGMMKLVWEGQGSVLPHFLHFKKVFEEVSSFCELHIITTDTYSRYGKFIKRDVFKILDQLPIKTIFHKWGINSKDKILSQCDCGIIPLDKNNLFGWHKPANKLISFWFTGLPTIVSDTPAYKELMRGTQENLYCSNDTDWVNKIIMIRNLSASQRQQLSFKNMTYVKKNFSDESLDRIWLKVFENIVLLSAEKDKRN
jgi:glycosyltransferase involved in cell wall biosynthesis